MLKKIKKFFNKKKQEEPVIETVPVPEVAVTPPVQDTLVEMSSTQVNGFNAAKILNPSKLIIYDVRIDIYFRSLSSNQNVILPVREFFGLEDYRLGGHTFEPCILLPTCGFQFRLPRKQNVVGEEVEVIASGKTEKGDAVLTIKKIKLLV